MTIRDKKNIVLSWDSKDSNEFAHAKDFSDLTKGIKDIDFSTVEAVKYYFMSNDIKDKMCFQVEAASNDGVRIHVNVTKESIDKVSDMMIEYWEGEQQ